MCLPPVVVWAEREGEGERARHEKDDLLVKGWHPPNHFKPAFPALCLMIAGLARFNTVKRRSSTSKTSRWITKCVLLHKT
jgi:hypothetical protein